MPRALTDLARNRNYRKIFKAVIWMQKFDIDTRIQKGTISKRSTYKSETTIILRNLIYML